VDAICINQSSLEERKQQVRLMAKIYTKAHRVIIWLGRGAVDTEGALEDIRLAANKELTERSKEEMNQQEILCLLQRQLPDDANTVNLGTSGGCRSSTCRDNVWFHGD
jgi:hypothetical protein